MTEDDWRTSADPAALLGWLKAQLRTDQRKLRLFICAACRLAWPQLRPAVRRLIRKLSTVPAARSPRRAASRRRGSCSSIHRHLVAEKYGSSTSPVRSCSQGWSFWWARQKSVVRRSCQTIARAAGLPLERSQRTAVCPSARVRGRRIRFPRLAGALAAPQASHR